jgi:hypothetical protein
MRALLLTALGALVRIAGAEHLRLTIHRYVTALLLGIVAVIAAIAAVAYGLGGLWSFLLPRVGPVGAYLIVAGALAVVSGSCAYAASRATRSRPRAEVRERLPARPTLAGGQFSGSGISGLASAAVAGFIVGLVRGRS